MKKKSISERAIIGFDHGLPCRVKNMALGPQLRQKPRPSASVFVYWVPRAMFLSRHGRPWSNPTALHTMGIIGKLQLKSNDKHRNTLGNLDQYMALNNKHTGGEWPPTPPQMEVCPPPPPPPPPPTHTHTHTHTSWYPQSHQNGLRRK